MWVDDAGHYVILVSSGAIGVGCQRLGLRTRPTKIAQKQALAAVGQVHLMRYYEDFLQALGLVSIQKHMSVVGCNEYQAVKIVGKPHRCCELVYSSQTKVSLCSQVTM